MSSGVKVHADCVTEFDKLKMKKEYSYIIFKLNKDMNEIIVDEAGDKTKSYDDLKALLLAAAGRKECRYAVYDLHFTFKEQPKDKLIFICWAPENAMLKQKMTYTSSKDYLKKALKIVLEAQATDNEELSMESLIERATRTMKD